jgi:hypothetical protein
MMETDPFTRLERKQKMISLMEIGDWKSVLTEFDSDDGYREPLLVWIRPSLEMLKFIEEEIFKLSITKANLSDTSVSTLFEID